MGVNRRGFLKAAGFTALGLAGAKPAVDALTGTEAKASSSSEGASGTRWAMVIDLKKCKAKEGCKACRTACHSQHNVPDFDNKKDECKWIWTAEFEKAFPDHEHHYVADRLKGAPTPVLCNHCDNPPCTRACPTGATFRRDDGIVIMDWHRCIGCRYCLAACPYGSRSFNWKDPRDHIEKIKPEFPTRCIGVVEKCTFCDERIEKKDANGQNLMPFCVEACPEKAMLFGDLSDEESAIRKALGSNFTIRRKPDLGTRPEVYYIV